MEVSFLGSTTGDHELRAMGHLATLIAHQVNGLRCAKHDRRPRVNIYCESGQLQFEIEGCCAELIETAERRVVPTERSQQIEVLKRIA